MKGETHIAATNMAIHSHPVMSHFRTSVVMIGEQGRYARQTYSPIVATTGLYDVTTTKLTYKAMIV